MSLILMFLFLFSSIIQVVHSNYDVNIVHLEQLSRNLARMFRVREHDQILTIVVNEQGYFAHKNTLSSASLYLKSAIINSKKKDVVKLPHGFELAHNDSFFHVLKYIYTGKLVLSNQYMGRMFDFISIARTLGLQNLREEISHLLTKSLDLDNVVQIYENACRYDTNKLKSSCEHFIDQNAEILFSQKSLATLSAESLKELIGRESFGINEAKICGLVIDWHVVHNRTDNLNMQLINTVLFERIPNEELINLEHSFNFTSGKIIQILKERAFNRNLHLAKSDRMASGSTNNSIKIWNAETGECIRTLSGHSDFIISLYLVASNILASGSCDNSVKLWNVDSGECIRTLTGHSNIVQTLQALGNTKLASGSFDTTIKIWNLESGKCVRTLVGHSNRVRSLQSLAGNGKLASGSCDFSIKIWNVDSGECVRTLLGHSAMVRSLQLLAYNTLASASEDKSIKIWDVETGECVRTLTGHAWFVTSLQSLGNNTLASGSDDRTIMIWNVDDGKCIQTLTGHSSHVFSLQLLANDRLASASSDYSMKIWNVDSGECIRTIIDDLHCICSL